MTIAGSPGVGADQQEVQYYDGEDHGDGLAQPPRMKRRCVRSRLIGLVEVCLAPMRVDDHVVERLVDEGRELQFGQVEHRHVVADDVLDLAIELLRLRSAGVARRRVANRSSTSGLE